MQPAWWEEQIVGRSRRLKFSHSTDNPTHILHRDVTVVLALTTVVGEGRGGRERERRVLITALDELHMQCWHISIHTAMCTGSCLFNLLSCIPTCHSTLGHGHMPLAWPADQHCFNLAWQLTMHNTHTLKRSSSDRWVKRWATSCVKWTEGRGVLAIMVKQTAKTDRHVNIVWTDLWTTGLESGRCLLCPNGSRLPWWCAGLCVGVSCCRRDNRSPLSTLWSRYTEDTFSWVIITASLCKMTADNYNKGKTCSKPWCSTHFMCGIQFLVHPLICQSLLVSAKNIYISLWEIFLAANKENLNPPTVDLFIDSVRRA